MALNTGVSYSFDATVKIFMYTWMESNLLLNFISTRSSFLKIKNKKHSIAKPEVKTLMNDGNAVLYFLCCSENL